MNGLTMDLQHIGVVPAVADGVRLTRGHVRITARPRGAPATDAAGFSATTPAFPTAISLTTRYEAEEFASVFV
jgi:hypothetical protein